MIYYVNKTRLSWAQKINFKLIRIRVRRLNSINMCEAEKALYRLEWGIRLRDSTVWSGVARMWAMSSQTVDYIDRQSLTMKLSHCFPFANVFPVYGSFPVFPWLYLNFRDFSQGYLFFVKHWSFPLVWSNFGYWSRFFILRDTVRSHIGFSKTISTAEPSNYRRRCLWCKGGKMIWFSQSNITTRNKKTR